MSRDTIEVIPDLVVPPPAEPKKRKPAEEARILIRNLRNNPDDVDSAGVLADWAEEHAFSEYGAAILRDPTLARSLEWNRVLSALYVLFGEATDESPPLTCSVGECEAEATKWYITCDDHDPLRSKLKVGDKVAMAVGTITECYDNGRFRVVWADGEESTEDEPWRAVPPSEEVDGHG